MENASKALLIAGGVLISLIIISALVLMFNNLSDYQKANVQNKRESEILAFNNEYLGYARNDVKGTDVYSLLNKVVDYNQREKANNSGYEPMSITIEIDTDTLNKMSKDRNE